MGSDKADINLAGLGERGVFLLAGGKILKYTVSAMLTKEQQAIFNQHRLMWEALPKDAIDSSVVASLVNRLYATRKLPPPIIIWCQSPWQLVAMPIVVAFLAHCNLPDDYRQFGIALKLPLWKHLWQKLSSQLSAELLKWLICKPGAEPNLIEQYDREQKRLGATSEARQFVRKEVMRQNPSDHSDDTMYVWPALGYQFCHNRESLYKLDRDHPFCMVDSAIKRVIGVAEIEELYREDERRKRYLPYDRGMFEEKLRVAQAKLIVPLSDLEGYYDVITQSQNAQINRLISHTVCQSIGLVSPFIDLEIRSGRPQQRGTASPLLQLMPEQYQFAYLDGVSTSESLPESLSQRRLDSQNFRQLSFLFELAFNNKRVIEYYQASLRFCGGNSQSSNCISFSFELSKIHDTGRNLWRNSSGVLIRRN